MTSSLQNTAIIGNEQLKLILAEFKKNLTSQTSVSVISKQLSLHAYNDLKDNLSKISSFKLLAPTQGNVEFFIKSLVGSHLDRHLRNQLNITHIARECSEWLKNKCSVRELASSIQQNFIHLSHANTDDQFAIVGSSSFTTDGLGIVPSDSLQSGQACEAGCLK